MRSLLLSLCLGLVSAADVDEAAQLVGQVHELDALTRIIQREYAMPISRDELWAGALRGMVGGLDGTSRYLEPADVALHGSMQAGRGVGYGFDWRADDLADSILITRIIPDSPAAAAGLAPGDRITAIDGLSTARSSLHEARRALQQTEKSIELSLLRPTGERSVVNLERGEFNDSGVLPGRMLEYGIGYLRIARFRDGRDADSSPTVQTFLREINSLREKGLQGLVLDLRGNGGGSVIAAVAIADTFLNAGHNEPRVIVEQVSRNPARNHRFLARSTNTLPDWPLVLLIDGHTASSAEIVASSLKDHRRATLVGQPSYGKNSIQELFVLDNGAALLLTVAHLRSPVEGSFTASGVQPHVLVEEDPVLRWKLHRQAHLEETGQEMPADLANLSDPVVNMARNMLRAAIIHSSH